MWINDNTLVEQPLALPRSAKKKYTKLLDSVFQTGIWLTLLVPSIASYVKEVLTVRFIGPFSFNNP